MTPHKTRSRTVRRRTQLFFYRLTRYQQEQQNGNTKNKTQIPGTNLRATKP